MAESDANDWALCVGIGHYVEDAKLGPLPGAVNDAQRFYQWVTSSIGGNVSADHSELILSPQPQSEERPKPIAHDIAAFLKRVRKVSRQNSQLGNGSRVGRRLYLYFSGHGVSLGAGEGAKTVLLASDAEPPDECEHFAGSLWADWFRVAGIFDELVLVMDCCRSEVHQVEPHKPPWKPRPAAVAKQGRRFYAFAVAGNTSAREIEIDGQPAGLFTNALMEILNDASLRPLTATKLMGLLYGRLTGSDTPLIDMPNHPSADFTILPAATPETAWDPIRISPLATDRLLLAYEDLDEVGSKVASAGLRPDDLAMSVARAHVEDLRDFSELVVASDRIGDSDLEKLVNVAKPHRAAIYSHRQPEFQLENLRWVQAHEDDSPALAKFRIRTALDQVPTAALGVRAEDRWAKLRVWNQQGELLQEGSEGFVIADLPLDTYKLQAQIGKSSLVKDFTLRPESSEVLLEAFPLDTAAPLPLSTYWSADRRAMLQSLDPQTPLVIVYKGLPQPLPGAATDQPAPSDPAEDWTAMNFDATGVRYLFRLHMDNRWVAMSVPIVAGYRTEVYAHAAEDLAPDVAIRLVPSEMKVGEGMHTDRLRESLRLMQMHGDQRDRVVPPTETAGDPIAALLALANPLTKPDRAQYLEQAAAVLGSEDADIQCWHDRGHINFPPLLAHSWSQSGISGTTAVEQQDSPIDAVVGRQVALGPWLAWDSNVDAGGRQWLRDVAARAWPDWDAEPELEFATTDLNIAMAQMDGPIESLHRRIYKSPPIERLIRHQEVAFVGASNDQLAAALAVAFVAREHKRWKRLAIYSLDDEPLHQMVSAGRSGISLRRSRDRAEQELVSLLPVIAHSWKMFRYDRFLMDDCWHFASLWDWTSSGGYVHVSPYDPGKDVRVTPAIDTTWDEGQADPSPAYAKAVSAYAAFAPSARLVKSG